VLLPTNTVYMYIGQIFWLWDSNDCELRAFLELKIIKFTK
jgi:hypothetical protein